MKIILRREDYDGANMSQDHYCVDCGCNTAPGMPTRAEVEAMFAVGHRAIEVNVRNYEQYIVHDAV